MPINWPHISAEEWHVRQSDGWCEGRGIQIGALTYVGGPYSGNKKCLVHKTKSGKPAACGGTLTKSCNCENCGLLSQRKERLKALKEEMWQRYGEIDVALLSFDPGRFYFDIVSEYVNLFGIQAMPFMPTRKYLGFDISRDISGAFSDHHRLIYHIEYLLHSLGVEGSATEHMEIIRALAATNDKSQTPLRFNSAAELLDSELKKVQGEMDLWNQIAVEDLSKSDRTRICDISLLESGLTRCVFTFQSLLT